MKDDPRANELSDDELRLLDELRATEPRGGEPDWTALQARIGAALDREPSPRRRARWRWAAVGAAALAAAAAIVLALGARRDAPAEKVAPAPAAEPPLTDDEVAEVLDTPDDLGGITVDDELIDEAAALDDEPDEDLDPLVPDGTWIDDLSNDELEWLEQTLETG